VRTDGKAEIQHYVPQVLLRLHVNDASAKKGSEQVWCFDKNTQTVFSPNIKGVLSASRFSCDLRMSVREPARDAKTQVGRRTRRREDEEMCLGPA
jgi:hypothetical protein